MFNKKISDIRILSNSKLNAPDVYLRSKICAQADKRYRFLFCKSKNVEELNYVDTLINN